ncbi:conserved hypothetical protein [uncultured Gammaproteobacteria bacterium]
MQPVMSLEDNRTLQAIGILADVLDEVSGPGVLDTVLVSKALRQVLATRSRPAFDFASRAFSTLDPILRGQIASEAGHAAEEAARKRKPQRDPITEIREDDASTASRPGFKTPTGGGLLAALNNRGRTIRGRPPGSKG